MAPRRPTSPADATASLPFASADTPPADPRADEARHGVRRVSLLRLVGEVASAFGAIGTFTVEGEVHQPKAYGQRLYFTLKDRGAQVSVLVPATRRRHAHVEEGRRVAVTGRLELRHERGQVQLLASEVTPVGEGAIAALLERTRANLAEDGLIGRPLRALPVLPRRIGVLCGTEAAVRKDIESVVADRFPGYPVRFLETTVQGAGAVDAILAGLEVLQADPEIDVVILARGGGDATQLLPFSDELVCRAIAACRVPVVSAIGHDGDRPISDEVADLRAGTPSIAAQKVVPRRNDLVGAIDRALEHARTALDRRADRADARLGRIAWRTAPDRGIDRAAARLRSVAWESSLDRRLVRAGDRLQRIDCTRQMERRIAGAATDLARLGAQVDALSPTRVLERGYAVVRDASGAVVRDVAAIVIGESVEVTVANGRFGAEVRDVR